MSFALRTLSRSAPMMMRPAAAAASVAAPRLFAVAFVAPRKSAGLSSVAIAQPKKHAAFSSALLARSVSTSTAVAASNVERPISPHVTVYDFPLPALSSITNRATGVALSVGVMSMGLVALGGGCDIPAYVEVVKTGAPILMPLLKMVVAFPLVYHTAAGVRHLIWDKTARGLDLETVEMTSKIVIGGSVVISFLLGFYSLPALK